MNSLPYVDHSKRWVLRVLLPPLILASCGKSQSTTDTSSAGDSTALSDARATIDERTPVDMGDAGSLGSMKLALFVDGKARGLICNDGTLAGYYIRRGASTKRWILHLQGGGLCYDDITCAKRWADTTSLNTGQRFMTSTGWASQRPGNGAQSTDPQENPDFFDWNHIFVPYCTSDLWSGDIDRGGGVPTGWRYFRGYRLFQALVTDLNDATTAGGPALSEATDVFLSGSSAGGAGVLVHCDTLAGLLPGVKVRCLNDAGWFVDVPPFDSTIGVNAVVMAHAGYSFWQGKVDASCANAYGGSEGKCYLGPYVWPQIATPLLVQINQTDPPQMAGLGLTNTAGAPAWVANFAAEVVKSLQPVPASFSPRNLKTHGIFVSDKFHGLMIDGNSLRDVTSRWFFGKVGSTKVIQQ